MAVCVRHARLSYRNRWPAQLAAAWRCKRLRRFGCKCHGFCTRYVVESAANGFRAVSFESTFAAAGVTCSEFTHISTIEDASISFADVERSQYQHVWKDSDYDNSKM